TVLRGRGGLEEPVVLDRMLLLESRGHGASSASPHAAAAASRSCAWLTLTETLRSVFPGSPITLPATGAASAGVRVTATGIRSADSAMPLVGSNSIQPRSGRKAWHQAWVAPAPRTSDPPGEFR